MRTEGTFTVESFTPVALDPAPVEVATAVPVGVAVMEKRFSGGIDGRSATIFTAAFNQGDGGMAIDEDGTHRIWFDYEA